MSGLRTRTPAMRHRCHHRCLHLAPFAYFWLLAACTCTRLDRRNLVTRGVLSCTECYFTVLYSAVLYCAVLCCTVLYCTVLYCTVLNCTVLYCIALWLLQILVQSHPYCKRFPLCMVQPTLGATNCSAIVVVQLVLCQRTDHGPSIRERKAVRKRPECTASPELYEVYSTVQYCTITLFS